MVNNPDQSIRSSGFLLAAIGAIAQTLAAYWDVYSHRVFFIGFDPWWNPAHLTLQAGALAIIGGLWIGLRQNPQPSTYTLGFRVAGIGAATEVVAGVWNEIWHIIYTTEPIISPPHALLVLGMIAVIFGMVLGMTSYYGIITSYTKNRKITLPILSALLMMFTSIWLVASGSAIYLAGILTSLIERLIIAGILALMASLVLASALLIIQKRGSAVTIGIAFGLINWLFLVGYVGENPYIPYAVITIIPAEIIYLIGRMRARASIVVVGGVMGVLAHYTYFPFSLFIYEIAGELTLLFMMSNLTGGILGALIALLLVRQTPISRGGGTSAPPT